MQSGLLKRIIDLLHSESIPSYISGGYVRDWLWGQSSKDVDLTVAGPAIPLARRIANETHGAFYVLDEDMDAARIVYREPAGWIVDVATLRGPDILADLKARDFTINAMAVDVCHAYAAQPELLDPCAGQSDLAAGILRATNERAFQQDPVRMLRALRFVATLNLQLEPQTESWIQRDAALITRPSAERIRQELALIVAADRAAYHLRRMDELGLLGYIIPELTSLKGVPQSVPHIDDIWEHTLSTVAQAERLTAFPHPPFSPEEEQFLAPFSADLATHFGTTVCEKRTRRMLFKIAALLHDVGKPAMRTVGPSGRIHFFGHERPSAELAEQVLTRLRFSTQEIHLVSTIVAHHMRPGFLIKEGTVSRRAIYRFFRDNGDASVDVLILSLADHLATRGPNLLADHWREHLQFVRMLLDNYYHRPTEVVSPPPLLTGHDLMKELHIPSGPRVGQLLEALREAQAEGRIRTKEEALEFLQQHG